MGDDRARVRQTQGSAMKDISVVVPVYNSEATLRELESRLRAVLAGLGSYEIILVNDGSRDGSYNICRELAEQHAEVKFIHFFRNFGQLSALLAGLRAAEGRACVILDDDLQDPPEEIPKLLAKLAGGFDFVFSTSTEPKIGWLRSLGSRFTKRVTNYLFDKPRELTHASFLAMTGGLVAELVRYDGPYPYIAGLIFRISQNGANQEVKRDVRKAGASGYSLPRLVKLWVNAVTTFSVVPLRVALLVGTLAAVGGFLVLASIVAVRLVYGYFLSGWASLFGATLLFSGLQLVMLGIVGEYVGRSFMVLNRTPQYAIKESYNCPAAARPGSGAGT